MNGVHFVLGFLLLLCLAGPVPAQTTSESDSATETASATATATETETETPSESEEVLLLLNKLESSAQALQALNAKIESVSELDREAMTFRRDERSLKLLLELDTLVRRAAQLPAEDPLRSEVQQRLREDLGAVSAAVFTRIDDVAGRIERYRGELKSLSGIPRIATETYINSLESLRFEYYKAMVDVIEGHELLGLPTDKLRASLQVPLYLHAETLAGLADFSGGSLRELRGLLTQDPTNADLLAAERSMSAQEQRYLERLETMVGLLERLELDASSYKSVLIRQGDSLSLRTLETGVVLDLLGEGWVALREAMVENAPDILLRLLLFVFVLLVFRSLSRLVRRAVGAACDRSQAQMSTLLRNVLISISGGTVMAIGVLMALSQIGISLGPMLAGLGVAGFVVGFALQDTLGNFAAGAMILIYRPYDVDDFVEVTGASGLVKKMSLVATTITTFDNQTLVVPNSKIWGDVIKNVTAQTSRRVDLEFGIGYADDIEHAERVLEDVVKSHDKVLGEPAALIKLHTLGDSSVNFVVRPWVRTEDYWDVYWYLVREVKLRFDREGISIPFPQRDVHLHNA